MTLTGPARRLTVIIGEDDTWHHKPLYTEIVHRAHKAGLAGASLSEDLPVTVVIIDGPEMIEQFQLDELTRQ